MTKNYPIKKLGMWPSKVHTLYAGVMGLDPAHVPSTLVGVTSEHQYCSNYKLPLLPQNKTKPSVSPFPPNPTTQNVNNEIKNLQWTQLAFS